MGYLLEHLFQFLETWQQYILDWEILFEPSQVEIDRIYYGLCIEIKKAMNSKTDALYSCVHITTKKYVYFKLVNQLLCQ